MQRTIRRALGTGRTAVLALFAVAVAALATAGGSAAARTSTVGEYLLAADTAAEKVYVYSLPSLELTGQLDDVKLGAHAGIVALPDGRAVFADDKNVEFVVMAVDADGRPVVIGRAAIPTPTPFGRAAWGMVDASLRYFAVSSDEADAAAQAVTILDLTTYQVGQVRLELNKNREGQYEEVHPYLGGAPLSLYVTTGEEIRSFLVEDVFAGTAQPTGSVRIPANPHGPVISPELGRLYTTTTAGVAVMDIVGARLERPRTIPGDADGIAAGRNARPRLSYDGGYIYGAVVGSSPILTPDRWAESRVYVHAADLRAETPKLVPLTTGIVGRFVLSEPYAMFVNINPDGDAALLFDVDPTSATFQQVVGRVPLEALSGGPVAGEPATGKEGRSAAMTPDGRRAFVSHGGDGRISVIDTAARAVAGVLELPTAMKGGGYLAAVQPGTRLVDLAAR